MRIDEHCTDDPSLILQRIYSKRYYYKNRKARILATAEYRRKMRRNNPDQIRGYLNNYRRRRKKRDIGYRLGLILRRRMAHALKTNAKKSSALILLGCSIVSFKIYLESRFESGMTWENYGSLWEIDHIMPCAIFDLSKCNHQSRCFHFSNLQPLLKTANRKKRCKIPTHCNLP